MTASDISRITGRCEVMTDAEMTPLAQAYRRASESRGRCPHLARIVGGLLVRTTDDRYAQIADVPVGQGRAVRYRGCEGDSGIYLEEWGYNDGGAMRRSAEYLAQHGWDVQVGVVRDGRGLVVTAFHTTEVTG